MVSLQYFPGGNPQGYVINPLAIPRIANKRIVAVSPPPRRIVNGGQNYYDMLESNVTGGFGNNRIVLVKYRPSPPPVPQSKVVYIEDVTDPSSTRLLRRELSPSPAPSLVYGSPWDITTPAGYVPCIPRPMFSVHQIPLRSASEVKEVADLRRLYVRAHNPDVGYNPLNKALLYRQPLPCYVDPSIPQNYYIGRGNLSCLSFAGGRPISKRRRFYPDYEDKIRDEVVFRSFYQNLRDAALVGKMPGKRPIYQPIYYSKKTILGEENVPKREPKESKWVERALANTKPPTPRPNKKAAPPEAIAKESVVAPARKESLKMEAAPRTPPPVKPVNVTLPGPRKSITEIIPEHVPKVENLPEEQVTIKIPKEASPPPPKEATPPPPPKEATPPPPKEATPPPPPKEATPPPPPPKEPTPPPPKEPTPPPPKEATPPPPPKEATPPPPPKEATPPPLPKEATPPPPAKEPTPPPPKEATPPPAPVEAAPPAPEETPAAAEAEASAPESGSVSEVSAPAAAASEQITGDEASNKGEVEEIQLDEEENSLCDVEENDLEIESDDPETSQSAAPIESPQETAGSVDEPAKLESEPAAASPAVEPPSEASAASSETPATQEPANNSQDAEESPAPVSIVIRDIDGPLPPPDEEAPAVQEELTVEQIQAEAERRREEFAKLLEEHAELVTTVTKLERVAVIVSKSCAEAIAQQENEQQPPTKTTTS